MVYLIANIIFVPLLQSATFVSLAPLSHLIFCSIQLRVTKSSQI